ncbi:hypothetical protein [Pantoea dispersa]|uniref:hypothetical protein n=1 Tax=Pantoea dispersa TaxID=59814 RepID=UPI000FD719F2|nr:hypothetical protein [Pantoea dispersa]RVU74690.1 hypothetical protein EKH82_09190 [Pantoea dispersa]
MNNFPAMTEAQLQELIELCEAVLAGHVQYGGDSNEEDIYKIALAALTAKPVGTIRIEMDWNTHRNVATLDMREDLVAADMATGDKLYTAPPAPALRVPDGWKLVPIEPTEAMMLNESGCQHHAWDDANCPMRESRRIIWKHMIEAAPEVE